MNAPRPSGPTSRRLSRLHLAATGLAAAIGYGVAAWKLAALSWDGAWYLFRSLQDRAPFIPHLRYGTYPILWLLVRASGIIREPATLGVCYGILLALFPLGSLALSWWFLRGEDLAPLRIWPTLGILLAALPGQFCLMSEATPAAQLLWPILAILVAEPPGLVGGIWLGLLSAAVFFLHPTAVFIFAAAGGLAGWRGWINPGIRTSLRVWAGIFLLLAGGQMVLTYFAVAAYERSQASWQEVWEQWHHSVLGVPLLILLLVFLLGWLLLAETGTIRLPLSRQRNRAICAAILVLLTAAGVRWAANPVSWSGLLDYRRFVLPAMLPLLTMAAWHYRHLRQVSPTERQHSTRWVLPWIGLAFCIVLITQSFAWGSLLDRFTHEVLRRATQERFVTAAELPFTRSTPLQHWTACPLSILLQGRRPSALFVLKSESVREDEVEVNPWEQIPLSDGWFTLYPMEWSSGASP